MYSAWPKTYFLLLVTVSNYSLRLVLDGDGNAKGEPSTIKNSDSCKTRVCRHGYSWGRN